MGIMDSLLFLMSDSAIGGEDDTVPDTDDDAGASSTDVPDYPAWMAQNKGELKQHEKLKDFTTINDLSQAYLELAERKEVAIPKDDASEDEWKDFYKKIGRPDSYEVPEEVLKRKEFEGIDSLYDRLHLTQKQADALNEFLKGSADRVLESDKTERTKSYETAVKAARDMWGVDYDDNMKYVNKFINTFGGEPLKRALQSTGADNRFVVLDAFSKVAKLLGPGYFTTGVIDTPTPPKGLKYNSEI